MFVNNRHHFKLEKFEGPLDLLWQLIEQEKLDISEISLAQIADQFVAAVNIRTDLTTSELADFLVVAAKLLQLKSRLLLADNTSGETEPNDLEKQLKIYKEYFEASRKITKILAEGNFLFNRQKTAVAFVPKFSPPPNIEASLMSEVFARALARLQVIVDLPKKALIKVISITEKIAQIRDLISKKIKFGFSHILSSPDRTEVIVSFLAILELAKQQTLVLEQSVAFGEIDINPYEENLLAINSEEL